MNILDISLLLILSIFIYKGYKKGVIDSIFFLIAIILSLYISYNNYEIISNNLKEIDLFTQTSNTLTEIISFTLIFISLYALIRSLANKLKRILKYIYLSWLDKILGSILGIVKGLILNAIIIFIMQKIAVFMPYIGIKENKIIKDSILVPHINQYSKIIIPPLLNKIKSTVNKKL